MKILNRDLFHLFEREITVPFSDLLPSMAATDGTGPGPGPGAPIRFNKHVSQGLLLSQNVSKQLDQNQSNEALDQCSNGSWATVQNP